jgi:hypothetical protein
MAHWQHQIWSIIRGAYETEPGQALMTKAGSIEKPCPSIYSPARKPARPLPGIHPRWRCDRRPPAQHSSTQLLLPPSSQHSAPACHPRHKQSRSLCSTRNPSTPPLPPDRIAVPSPSPPNRSPLRIPHCAFRSRCPSPPLGPCPIPISSLPLTWVVSHCALRNATLPFPRCL